MTPEMNSKIADYRARIQAGTITREEMIQGIKLLRADRLGAAIASEKSKVKRATGGKPEVDVDNLLDGFV